MTTALRDAGTAHTGHHQTAIGHLAPVNASQWELVEGKGYKKLLTPEGERALKESGLDREILATFQKRQEEQQEKEELKQKKEALKWLEQDLGQASAQIAATQQWLVKALTALNDEEARTTFLQRIQDDHVQQEVNTASQAPTSRRKGRGGPKPPDPKNIPAKIDRLHDLKAQQATWLAERTPLASRIGELEIRIRQRKD